MIAALPGATPAGRLALLAALAPIGGHAALAALSEASRAGDPAVREVAIAALAEHWPDSGALELLQALAGDAPEPALRIVALRGFLRLLGTGLPAEQVMAGSEAALALATRAEERRAALAVLRGCRTPAAVTLAARLLDDPELAAEALECVLHLTAAAPDGPAVTGPEAEAALARVSAIRDRDLPAGWHSYDIGDVSPRGTLAVAAGVYTLRAAGADIWGGADGCLLVAQQITGDATITALVEGLERTNEWAKAGVMFRESTAAGARNVFLGVSPAMGGTFQWRAAADRESTYHAPGGEVAPPHWVRLQRRGDEFRAWLSADGATWREVGRQTLALPAELLVGLAVSSHNAGAVTVARFSEVRLEP